MAVCPNCKSDIDWNAPTCKGCGAVFSLDSAWRPLPANDEETENLANKFAAQTPAGESPGFGEGSWVVFKALISIVLILVALLLGFVALRGPKVDWAATGFIGLFVFLAALLWVDFERPNRALALGGVVLALGMGAIGRGYLNGSSKLPLDCTTARRWWFCELENQLYALGGKEAVAILWFLIAAGFFYGAYLLFIRSRGPLR